jgi:hypothetical protein
LIHNPLLRYITLYRVYPTEKNKARAVREGGLNGGLLFKMKSDDDGKVCASYGCIVTRMHNRCVGVMCMKYNTLLRFGHFKIFVFFVC